MVALTTFFANLPWKIFIQCQPASTQRAKAGPVNNMFDSRIKYFLASSLTMGIIHTVNNTVSFEEGGAFSVSRKPCFPKWTMPRGGWRIQLLLQPFAAVLSCLQCFSLLT